MDRFLFKISRASSAVLAATLLLTGHSDVQAQITSDLTSESTDDVQRTDSAYQILQQLQAKYDCAPTKSVVRQTISRMEFATDISNCAQSIEQLMARRSRKGNVKKRMPTAEVRPVETPAEATPPAPTEIKPVEPPQPEVAAEPAVTQQDLDRLKGLVQSFSSELSSLDARVGTLDKKTAELKAQSFSTTTKLAGEVIIGVNGYGGVTARAAAPAVGTTPAVTARSASSTILTDRVRLNLDTSFTGKDRLRTRLQSRNTAAFNSAITGTNMTRLGFDGDEANGTSVSLLQYSFPLSDQTKIIVETVGTEFNENMNTFNGELSSSGSGSISQFGRYNPVYRVGGFGGGLTVNHKFSDGLGLAVGYAIPGAASTNLATGVVTPATIATPTNGNGLFNGSNAIISQLSFRPSEDLNLGLVYARAYTTNGSNITGGTGSSTANSPFGAAATTANHYSVLANYKVSPNFVLSGWAGLVEANREAAGGGSASSSNYAVSLAFPDFGSKGNNLAFIVGVPPKLNSRNVPAIGTVAAVTTTGNPSTSYHLEALYKIKLSGNLEITPGLLLITNPEHNSANPTEYVGTIRTTFKF